MQPDPVALRWIRLGIAAGFTTCVVYPLLIFADLPLAGAAVCAGLMGPALGVASYGLREMLLLHRDSVCARLGALSNFMAGALLTAMLMVQIAAPQGPEARAARLQLQVVWLGLDVAWDVYIGLGTLLMGIAMLRHPRFGRILGGSGILLALVLLSLNLATFPTPPANAGSFDAGPLVGLWYLVITIQTWRSLSWARERARYDPRLEPHE